MYQRLVIHCVGLCGTGWSDFDSDPRFNLGQVRRHCGNIDWFVSVGRESGGRGMCG